MRNPFEPIVVFEDYKEIIGVPKEQLNSQEIQNRINKWLVQATEQFDSMISGTGELGRIYRWYKDLSDSEEDTYKKYKIKKSICSWVETFVIKGKFWVDGVPAINSNVNIEINASSDDSNVEAKRKDIIQDLVALGLYQTTNFSNKDVVQEQVLVKELDKLIVITKDDLETNYLKRKPQAPLLGNLDFSNNDILNGGNIEGSLSHSSKPYIKNYELIESKIDLSKNTIVGEIEVAKNAKFILDPIDNIYKMINQYDAHYFGTLTTQEIYNAIYASGISWSPDILYKVKWIVQAITKDGELWYFECIKENINKDPLLKENQEYWRKLAQQEVDINIILEQIRPQLPQLISQELNKLPQVNFVMEAMGQVLDFPSQTDYDNFKAQYNIDDTYFEDVVQPSSPLQDITILTMPNKDIRPNGYVSFGIPRQNLLPSNLEALIFNIEYSTQQNLQIVQTLVFEISSYVKSKLSNNDTFRLSKLFSFYTPDNKLKHCLINMSFSPNDGPVSLNANLNFDNDTPMTLSTTIQTRSLA